jgi:hypothetical protein
MLQDPHKGRPNTIVVGTGENRVIKAQVTIIPRGGQTELRISPGGVTLDLLINTVGVARKIRGVLASSRSLSARQACLRRPSLRHPCWRTTQSW